jgi:FkbM family methyltransferase
MRKLENIYIFFDTISIIVRNISPLSKKVYYLGFFVWISLIKPKRSVLFDNKTIYFSNFTSFVASLTEIFFSKSIDFASTTNSPYIIDCGANIGLSALYYKTLYPTSKLICIEAVPKTFKLLKKNLKEYNNISLYNNALSNQSGRLVNIPTADNNFDAAASLFKTPKTKTKVTTIQLSKLLTKDIVDCLILDIEGNEEKILEDLTKANKLKLIRNIFVEFHNYQNGSLSKITSILSDNGYVIIPGCGVRPPYNKYKGVFYALPMYAYSK